MRETQRKKFILLGYRNKAIKLYTPKRNKFKVGLLLGIVGVLLITPATNWLLYPIKKVLVKFPLWVYQ